MGKPSIPPEEAERRATFNRNVLRVGAVLSGGFALVVALFGTGGFSNTDDQVALGVERFLFSLMLFGPWILLAVYIIGAVTVKIRQMAQARRR